MILEKVIVDTEKCTECLDCQLICSLICGISDLNAFFNLGDFKKRIR